MLVAVIAVPPALPPWDASAIVRQDALLDRFLLGRLADRPRPSPEVGWAQLAPDPLVTPGRVLLGHADDQLLDILVQRWPTGWRCG
jgi:hypothetical protein